MNLSRISFSSNYRARLVKILWRQWTTLGVAGSAEKSGGSCTIDPEALLLASTGWARWDPRLFDEILDWLDGNADWINLQRLSRMREEQGLGQGSILAPIAARLARTSSHSKWKALTGEKAEPNPHSLFPQEGHFGEADEVFQAWGWNRPVVRLRGLSNSPSIHEPANLLLKLRALFGRQSRAEVMGWLLMHDCGTPTQIALDLGYFKRSVWVTLAELERSGHVFSKKVGREKQFSLRHSDWKFLSKSGGFPRWIRWSSVFGVLEQGAKLLADETLLEAKPNVQAIEWRQLDFGKLVGSGLSNWLSNPIDARGVEMVDACIERLDAVLSEVMISGA